VRNFEGSAGPANEGGFTLVELMVALTIMGLVMGAITSTVISTMRLDQQQVSMQDVIDDGRISLQAIRRELRSARRVHEGSDSRSLRFWVDQDQDQIVSPEEEICYLVEPFGTRGDQWQISRWTNATEPEHCQAGATPPAGGRRVVARTLVDPDAFVEYLPVPAGPDQPATREVHVLLELEVAGARNIDSTTVETSIRLRNVP
jgi:prepilin-type N-terminal cleavage/methylation domain-containing protein